MRPNMKVMCSWKKSLENVRDKLMRKNMGYFISTCWDDTLSVVRSTAIYSVCEVPPGNTQSRLFMTMLKSANYEDQEEEYRFLW